MLDQPHIGVGENITLPFASIIEGHLFRLAPDTAHTGTIFAFKTRFYGCHAAKGGCDSAKNGDSAIIVEKEQNSSTYAEGA